MRSLTLSLTLALSGTIAPPALWAQSPSPLAAATSATSSVTGSHSVKPDTTVLIVPITSDSGKLAGQLSRLIKEQMAKAAASSRTFIVVIGATWCPPCKKLEARITKNDPAIVDAFSGAYVVHLDVDDWKDTELGSLGFDGGVMPVLYVVDPTGKAGDHINEGDNAWRVKNFVRKHANATQPAAGAPNQGVAQKG